MSAPAAETASVRSGRLLSVDILRALAALAVLVNHLPLWADDAAPAVRFVVLAPREVGYLGVTLFLVLSGFCIHLGVARGMARGGGVRADWVGFWRRRFFRLYPPYAAAIVFGLLCYSLAGRPRDPGAPDRILWLPGDLLAHLLLVHNLFADYRSTLGNAPLWTLGLEEQLYALYAVYLLVRRRGTAGQALKTALAVALVWRFGVQAYWAAGGVPSWEQVVGPFPVRLDGFSGWPPAHWLAWVLGAVAAEAYAGAVRLPGWCFRYRTAVAFALGALLCNHFTLGRLAQTEWAAGRPGGVPVLALGKALTLLSEPLFAAATFVVVNAWVCREKEGAAYGPVGRGLAAVGVMSYSLYLTHWPLIKLADSWLPPEYTLAGSAWRSLLLVPPCLGFGALFFLAVERHFLHKPPAVASGARPSSAPALAAP